MARCVTALELSAEFLARVDPEGGGAFPDADVAPASRVLRDYRHVRFAATGHQIHRSRPAEVLAALRDLVHSFATPHQLPTP